MKNLKKTLAVVLAFAMVLSFGAISTFAYSDVEASTTTGEAVGILSNLGILSGFEDGTFRPEETVTRAQMASIIVRTLGYDSQAVSSAGSTVFSDVAADHWASGYINVAQAQGIISGYGNGMFGPEDKVTYEQAVKMIVSALGYDLIAVQKGGYPTGYLAVASAEGITKNANGRVGDPAKRSSIAILVYNSLEVRLLDQSTWTTDGSDEYKKTDKTILSDYLNVEKWEGVVTDVPYVEYATNGYDEKKQDITIDGYESYYSGGVLDKDYGSVTANASLVDAGSLLGKKVVAYVGAEEDDETDEIMVYAIAEKKGNNSSVTVSGTQLAGEDYSGFDTAGQISYKKGSKTVDASLADNVKFYVNFKLSALDKTATTEDVADEVESAGGSVELISNDADSDIEVVVITAYEEEAVIEDVTTEDGVISFETYTGSLDDVDLEDEDSLVVVYKDGELAKAEDLAANDTVSIINVVGDFVILYASSSTVTGSVDSYDEDYVTIGSVEYELSPASGKTPESIKDEEGTFFLNVDGQIAHNETETVAGGNYGLVIAADKSTGISNGYEAQVILADGTVATYPIAKKAKAANSDNETQADGEAAVYNYLAGKMNATGSVDNGVQYAKASELKNLVFKVTVKNGSINKLKEITGPSALIDDKKYDEESMTYGSLEFDEATVVFAVDYDYTDDDKVDADDVTVGEVADFFVDGEEDYKVYGYDYDDVHGVVLGFELSSSVPADSDAVIVTSVKSINYDDDTATVITGLQAGKEVTYTIYDEDGDYRSAGDVDPEDLKKGDVILVGNANSDGVVGDFKPLFVAASKTAANIG
ncbi:MAG: S-layer homology domain-containing protein, partial [Clostridia bacterium]|nr:S-layer homology domain-containing protein [Clostridia bacterium]